MSRNGLPKEKVVATVIRLLETTFARVGNEEYAKENKSFGLTTRRYRNVDVRGATVRFVFRGKSGVEVQVGITNRRVARVIKRCEELPGQHLFQYVDVDGERRTVTSDDVNQYLREVTGEDFTAKDFRTWAGTVLAVGALRDAAEFESESEAKRKVVAAIDEVAHKLGHTRAVCRRSYVHPVVIDTYLDGRLEAVLSTAVSRIPARLKSDEAAVLSLVRRKARRKAASKKSSCCSCDEQVPAALCLWRCHLTRSWTVGDGVWTEARRLVPRLSSHPARIAHADREEGGQARSRHRHRRRDARSDRDDPVCGAGLLDRGAMGRGTQPYRVTGRLDNGRHRPLHAGDGCGPSPAGTTLIGLDFLSALRPSGVVGAGSVDAVVCVRAEIVAQALDQVGGAPSAPVPVVVRKR